MINKQINKELNECFNGLVFDADKHKYTLNNKHLISTTTFLKRFFSPFNSYMISEAKGNKNLRNNPLDTRTGQYYRKRWKNLGTEAATQGTRVHDYAETYPYFDEPRDIMEQGVLDFYNWIPANYEVVALELRVYDEETKHAGTIDGILYNRDTGKLVIFDWKTNKKDICEQYGNKKMLNEFKEFPDTSFSKFTLQLSDYANTLNKNTPYEVEDRWIVWLNKNENNRPCAVSRDTFCLFKLEDVASKINEAYMTAIYGKKRFTTEGLVTI